MLIPPMPTSSKVTPGGRSGCPARHWSTATPNPSSPLSTLPNPTTNTRFDFGPFASLKGKFWILDFGFCVDWVIGQTGASAEGDGRDVEGQLDRAVADRHRDHGEPALAAVQALAGARVKDAVVPRAE